MIEIKSLLEVATALAYVFLVVYAGISDFRKLLISNWIPISLALLFFVYALLVNERVDVFSHVLVGFGMLAIGLALFAAGWMAGGDVKLLSAVLLWAGPANALGVLFVVALFGGLLALTIIVARFFLRRGSQTVLTGRLPRWIRLGLCPYGVAISLGALFLLPVLF